jgi:hypothetical protein
LRELASFRTDSHSWIGDSGSYKFLFSTSSCDVKIEMLFHIDSPVICEKLSNSVAPKNPSKFAFRSSLGQYLSTNVDGSLGWKQKITASTVFLLVDIGGD